MQLYSYTHTRAHTHDLKSSTTTPLPVPARCLSNMDELDSPHVLASGSMVNEDAKITITVHMYHKFHH